MKKQLQKFSKKSMAIISIVVAFITIIALSITFAAEEVKVSILQTPKIDIALARSRTTVDLGSFKQDLLGALSKKGVDPNKVNIIDVESTEANIQTSFTWNQNISSSIGSIAIANGGRNVVMYGNTSNPGKNAIWIMSDTNGDEKFTFDYSINFGDSFNAAGMLLNVKQTSPSVLEGYMLSFNNYPWRSACGANGAIWKFTYNIGTNNQAFGNGSTIQLIQGLNIATSGTLSVTASDGLIEITGGGLTNEKVKLPTIYGKGFGFFSDHYSHGCDQIGNFNLSNIRLDIINYKKISQTLREPTWRENALRLMVNVDDYAYESFDDDSYLSEIVTRVINDDLYYVAWGTNANKVDAQKLISSINNKGDFIDNTNYQQAIDNTATYIAKLLGGQDSDNIFCLGDDIDLKVTPENLKTNTADENWPSGRWKVDHQYDYYENNNGQYAQTGVYTNDLNIDFNKVGKYVITYEDKNIVPTEIYVHRKPVASFNIKRTGNVFEDGTQNLIGDTIELDSTSYDLDKLSDNDGIQEEEWSYKTVADSDWIEGKLPMARNDTTYLVRLRVKDFQDKWSDYETKYISSNSSNPIASFSVKDSEITLYEQLQIIDSSYDPSGKNLTNYTWKVSKDKDVIYMDSKPLLDYMKYGKGTYTMELVVTNSDGAVSEPYVQKFSVIDDEIAPEVIADPVTDGVTNKDINVHLSFTDQGGSGFAYFKYAIADVQNASDTDLDWSGKIRSDEYDIKLNKVGDNYIYVKAVDNAGNESDVRILGDYCIEQTSFKINLQLIDFDNPNILLGDAKFTLIQPKKGIFDERKTLDGVTDSTGMITFDANAMEAGTYDYILYETEAPTDYQSITLGAVRITFDENGNVSKVEKVIYSTDLLEIKDDYTATDMNIVVKNKTLESVEQEKQENAATLNLSVVDSKEQSQGIAGAIYSITTESNDKNWSITNILTDSYGKISVPLQGDGNIKITIKEQQPISGYQVDTQEKVVMANIKDGQVQYIISKDPDTILSTISKVDNSVNVILNSARKEENNVIKLKLVDSDDTTVALNGVTFDMTLPDNSKRTAVTDDDGYATFTSIPQESDGDKIYTFTQRSSSYGYEDLEDVSVKVTFKDGCITGVDEATTNGIIESKFEIDEEDSEIANVGIFTVGISADTSIDKYNFLLTLEEKDSDKVISGARYKISIQSGENVKSVVGTTNKSGEIKVSVPVSDDVRIYVNELVSALGYIATPGDQAIQLGLNEKGKLEIVNSSNVKEQPYISDEEKLIKLFDSNEARTLTNVSKLSVYITKVDEYNSKIQNLNVKVTGTLIQDAQILKTDKSGRISIKALEPGKEGTYDFIITELNSDKTENTDSTIKVRVKYQYLEGYLQVTGIQVLQGNKYVKAKEYANYQSIDNYQSDVKITTYAKGEVDIGDSNKLGVTSVDFAKVDKKGKQLEGAEYILNITRPDGTVLSKDGIKVDNASDAIELPLVYIPNGSIIELTETKAPIGYALDKNTSSYQVAIDEKTNKMTLNGGTIKADVSQTETNEGNSRYSIKFTAVDAEVVPNYELDIIKTTENDIFKTESAGTFDVSIQENNELKINKSYTTDKDGMVKIDSLSGLGSINVMINEKDQDPIDLQLSRDANDYSFTILKDPTVTVNPTDPSIVRNISVSIDNSNQIVSVYITETANLRLNITNVDYQYNTKVANAGFLVTIDELDAGGNVKQTVDDHTLKSDGNGNIAFRAYKKFKNEKVRVTLKEESKPDNYDDLEDIVINLQYDGDGHITDYSIDNDKGVAKIDNNPNVDQGINMTVYQRKLDGLNLGITGVDSVTKTDGVEGAKFLISQDIDNSGVMTNPTDNNGNVEKVVGAKQYNKTVTYTIKNIDAGPEYKLLDEDITFSVNYTDNGLVDKSSFKIISGSDICQLLDLGINSSSRDIDLLINFIPKDKFFVDVETVDSETGIIIPNIPVSIVSSYGKTGKETTNNAGIANLSVGYAAEGLPITYKVSTSEANDKYVLASNEEFRVKFDKNGNIDADGCNSYSKLIDIKDSGVGTKTAKIILKLKPKLSAEINVVDAFNNDIKVANAKIKVTGVNVNSNVTTDKDGKAISYMSPFGNGESIEYIIKDLSDSIPYIKIPDGKVKINFDSQGLIIGTPTIEGIKNAKLEVIGQGTNIVPNLKITLPAEPKVKFTMDNIDVSNGNKLPLVGTLTMTSLKTGESVKFDTDGIASLGAFGTNETINYRVSQSNVPLGYTAFSPFELQVTYDNDHNIVKAIKSDNNANNVVVNRQASDDISNKWYTGNSKGAVEIQTKSYPIVHFNITNMCSTDNTAINGAIYDIYSSDGLHVESEKTNNDGKVTSYLGETKEGTIIYKIKQLKATLGYKLINSDIEIAVKYDAEGHITAESKNPRVTFGNEIATITKSGESNIDLTISSERIDGNGLGIDCQCSGRSDQKLSDISYNVSKVELGYANGVVNSQSLGTLTSNEFGTADMLLGKYQNTSIVLRLQQTSTQSLYEQQHSQILISISYDANGKISRASVIEGGLYVKVDTSSQYYLRLVMIHFPKLQITSNAVDKYDTQKNLTSSFTVSDYYMESANNYYGYITLSDTKKLQVKGTADDASCYINGVRPNSTRTYWLYNEATQRGYQPISNYYWFSTGFPYSYGSYGLYLGYVQVTYDGNGGISKVVSSDPARIIPSLVEDNHINISLQYTKQFVLTLHTKDNVTDKGISRAFIVQPRQSNNYVSTNGEGVGSYYWNGLSTGNGYYSSINVAEGEIVPNSTKTFTLEDYFMNSDRYISKEKQQYTVSFDEQCNVSGITGKDGDPVPDGVVATSEGQEAILEMGYESRYSINLHSERISDNKNNILSVYKVSSNKGDSTIVKSNVDTVIGKKYPGETVKYKIEQLEVSNKYVLNTDEIYMYVTFNKDGTQKIEFKGNSNIDKDIRLDDNKELLAKATVFNDQRVQFNLSVHDNLFPEDVIKDAKFEVTSNKNESARNTVITDKEGIAQAIIGKTYNNTTVEYSIRQINTITGYYKNDTVVKILATYDDKSNIVEAIVTQGEDIANIVCIPDGSNEIDFELVNKAKDINLGIETKDKLTKNGIKNVGYTITKSIDNQEDETYNFLSKENGEDINKVDEYVANKTVTYTIDQTSIEGGYAKFAEPLKFKIVYGEDSKPISYSMLNKLPNNVSIQLPTTVRPTLEESGTRADIKISVIADNSHSIKITDLDNRIATLPVDGSKFKFTVSTDTTAPVTYSTAITDDKGVSKYLDLVEEGTINIHFEQTEAGPGYKYNPDNRGDIVLEKKDNHMKLISTDAPEGVDVAFDEDSRQLSIGVKNETQVILNVLRTDNTANKNIVGSRMKIYQSELDKNGNAINKTEIGDVNQNVTDDKGLITCDLGNSPIAKTYQYEFDEIETPDEYDKLNPIKVTVTYDNNGMIKKITDDSAVTECTVANKLTMNVGINSGIGDIGYAIKLKTIDEETKKGINDSVFKVSLSKLGTDNPATILASSYKTQDVVYGEDTVLDQGVASISNIMEYGEMKLSFTQTGRADGYVKLDPNDTPKYDLNFKSELVRLNDGNTATVKLTLENELDGVDVQVDDQNKTILIIVTNKANPAYSVRVISVDNDDDAIRKANQNLGITITNTVGEDLTFGQNGTTNGNGEIYIPEVKGFGDIDIKIAQTDNPILAPAELKLFRDPEARTITSNYSKGVKCEVDNEKCEITIYYLNKQNVGEFSITLNNLTEAKDAIPGIFNYAVKDPDGNTKAVASDENGMLTLTGINVPKEPGVASYKFTLQDAPEICDPDEKVGFTLNIYFDYNVEGNLIITNASIGDTANQVEITKLVEQLVKVNVYSEAKLGYNVKFVSVDLDDHDIRIGNQAYKININNEIGAKDPIEQDIETDENGECEIKDIVGCGNISITAEATEQANVEKSKIILTRDPETKIITVNSAASVDYDVVNETNTIILYLSVRQSDGQYSLVLNNVSKNDKPIEDEFKYQVTSQDGTSKVVTSNDQGVVALTELPIPVEAGTQDYSFKCIEKPEICNQDEEISFKATVVFDTDADGILGVTNVLIAGSEDVEVNKTRAQLVKLNVKHDAGDELPLYNVKVINVDDDDPDWRISGTQMNIEISNQYGEETRKVSDVTSPSGEIDISDIEGYGDIIISLGQDGVKDPEIIKLFRDPLTGIIKCINANIDYNIDNDTALVTLKLTRKTEDGKYSVSFNNIDSETNEPIQDLFNYELVDSTGKSQIIETNERGRIELRNIDMPAEEGKVEYTVKPTYVPTGYALNQENEIKLEITFAKVDDTMQIVEANIVSGDNATVDKYTKQVVKVNISNTKDDSTLGKYAVIVNKVDADTKENILGETELQVTLPNGEVKNYTTNEDGRLELLDITRPAKEGTYLYEIREVTPPEGYQLLEEAQVLAVTFAKNEKTNEMEVAGATIEAGNSVEIMDAENKNVISLNLLNKNDSAFDIQLINVDVDDYDFRIPDTEYSIKVTGDDGEVAKEVTDKTGLDGTLNVKGIDIFGDINVNISKPNSEYSSDIKLHRNIETDIIKADNAKDLDYQVDNQKHIVYIFVLNYQEEGQYSVVFSNMDSKTRDLIKDVFEYEVTDNNGNKQTLKTNANGRLELTDLIMPEEDGSVTYDVKPLYIPSEYKFNQDSIKLNVDFANKDGNMQIVNANIVSGDNAVVDRYTQQLVKVNILNDLDDNKYSTGKYGIVLNNQMDDSNILDETNFDITAPDGTVTRYTTDEDGQVELLNIEKPNKAGTYDYKIKQVNPVTGCVAVKEEQVLSLTFDMIDNKIVLTDKKVTSGTNLNIIDESTDNLIQLNFVNVKNKTTFDIQVINVDKDDYDFRISNVKFNIKVSGEDGQVAKEISDKTGSDGIINVKGIEVYGDINVNINQPDTEFNSDMKLHRNLATDVIKADTASNLDYDIDNERHIVYVYVLNTQTEGKYSVVFSNMDSKTNEPIKDMFEYEVKDNNGHKNILSTNADGRLELKDLDMPQAEGSVVYEVRPLYVPSEYKFIADSIKLNVDFAYKDGSMRIASANIVSGDNAIVNKCAEQLVKVNMLNIKEENPSIGKYGIVLNNKIYESNILNETDFDITAPDGTVTRYTTNEDGQIELLNIEKPSTAGTYNYKIKQVSRVSGCEAIDDEQVLSLTFDNQNGKLVLTDKKVTSGSNLVINDESTSNLIQLNFMNNKLRTNFGIQVIDVDKDDYDFRIPNAEFNVKVTTDDGDSKEVTASTNESGIIDIPDINAYGNINVDIHQTNDVVNGTAKVFRNHATDAISVSEASNIDYVIDTNKNIIYMFVLNEQEDDKYTVVFANVDAESNDLIRDSFEFEVTAEGRTKTLSTNANGRLELSELDMPESPETIEYTVTPIYVPTGYIFSKTSITVAVEFNRVDGKMQIVGANITDGNNASVEKVTAQLVKVNISNAIDTDNPYVSGKYAIVINNKFAAANTNILKESKFDVVAPDGTTSTYTTNAKGRAEILNIAKPEKAGTYYYTIKQTQAPDGFPVNVEEQKIGITFDIVDNKVVIVNTSIISGNSLKVEPTKNANVIQLDFLNTKDQSKDLYIKVSGYEIINNDNEYMGSKDEYASGDIYLNRIKDKTLVSDFINNLDTNATKVVITNQKGEEVDHDAYVGTGMTLTLTKDGSDTSIQLMLVVTGDLNGNGKVGIVDTSRIESHYLNIKKLNQLTDNETLANAYLKAADINNDGKISIVDTSKMSSYYLKLTDVLYK